MAEVGRKGGGGLERGFPHQPVPCSRLPEQLGELIFAGSGGCMGQVYNRGRDIITWLNVLTVETENCINRGRYNRLGKSA
jgi:hypothetical protein